MRKAARRWIAVAAVLVLAGGGAAEASLTAFQSFTGKVGVSTDGLGSQALGELGNLTINAPSGSTVLAAYLYTATYNFGTPIDPPSTQLNGVGVTYGPRVPNATACCQLASHRANVTAIVKPIIDAGPGGAYNFSYSELAQSAGSNGIDGSALVVVFSNPALPDASVGILDGFASVTGDNTQINFLNPLHPANAGFFAEMRLGIGFSCCGQESRVDVNGVTITNVAGNNDDGIGSFGNGQLFTMGGDDDPFSALLPAYADDHERYNLIAQITDGDTSISIDTVNASEDDNIFVAVFHVSGIAGFNEPPPNGIPFPGTLLLLGSGLLGVAAWGRRRR